MVLFEFGNGIIRSLSKIQKSFIDKKSFDIMLVEIGNSLVRSDVDVALVIKLKKKIIDNVNFNDLAPGINKYKIIRKIVFKELENLINSGYSLSSFPPKKHKINIIMFVGLQGSGKTTTICKFANYYNFRGFSPGLICADTFRAGAFDQLKQNAMKIKVPYYGDYCESDPIVISRNEIGRAHV